MGSHFCLSVRFLDAMFHGRSDGDNAEWPPSPLRLFQALVAAAARRNAGELAAGARSALKWLEQKKAPVMIAPAGITGLGYSISVPNNAMDIVARAWSKGNESSKGDANPATHRTMKFVRPVLLEGDTTHYIWRLPDLSEQVLEDVRLLSETATSVVALGWGLDLTIGRGALLSDREMDSLPGERWLPAKASEGKGLRVPVEGTLEDILRRHRGFRERLGPSGFVPPPLLSFYTTVDYRRATDPPVRPLVAFSLLRPNANGYRPFDSARGGLRVAGMTRSAVKTAAEQSEWPESKIASFVLGHGEPNGTCGHVSVGPMRFAYLPLPSIEARNKRRPAAGSVRRIMISTFATGCEEEIGWAQRTISGQELRDEQTRRPVALLSLIPGHDNVVRCYLRSATVWTTVTPVVLPGFDDPRHYRRRMQRSVGGGVQRELLERLDIRIDKLLRRAIVQAGFSETLATNADVEWRKAGFWPGTDMADHYGAPDHLKRFPRYHVRIQWRNERSNPVKIGGPVCLGGGRFYGLGLFAPE